MLAAMISVEPVKFGRDNLQGGGKRRHIDSQQQDCRAQCNGYPDIGIARDGIAKDR